MNKLMTATAVTVVLFACAAQASTVTQTQTSPFFNIGSGGTTLNFNAFDPSLGTFKEATLTVDATVAIAAGSISGRTIDAFGVVEFSTFVNYDIGFSSSTFSDFSSLGIFAFCEALNPGDVCTANYSADSDAVFLSDSATSAGDFDSPFSIDLSVATGPSDFAGRSIGRPTTSWLASGTATLTYSFEPVTAAIPLPASLPLALGGIALLGAVARRRKG